MLSEARDIIVSVAAIATAIFAYRGLKTWKQELTGRAQFEVARALAKSTYRLRDKFHESRSPLVMGAEFPNGYNLGNNTLPAEEVGKAWGQMFNRRMSPLIDAFQEFELQVLEAEALWGPDIKEPADEIRKCIRELQVAMEAIVDDKFHRGEVFQSDKDFGQTMRAVAFASRKEKDNALSTRLDQAVTKIEKLMRPHLVRP